MYRVSAYFLGPLSMLLVILFKSVLLKQGFSEPQTHVLAISLWVILWWITDIVPNSVTALLPLVLLPILGVETLPEAAKFYSSPTIFLFMGGFFIAMAMQKYQLHSRIALNMLKITGVTVPGIVAGFMLSTAFLSMWISNTAAVVMMLPIANSIVKILEKGHAPGQKDIKNFKIMLVLVLAYASTFGGIASLIGTPSNLLFAGLMQEFMGSEISFLRWMLVGLPFSAIMLSLMFLVFTKILFRTSLSGSEEAKMALRNKLSAMGKITKEEKLVSIVFVATAFCWLCKSPLNTYIFKTNLLSDVSIALMGGVAMFTLPLAFSKKQFLLSWSDTQAMPWGVLILFGGGLCLANALEKTNLIETLISSLPLHNASLTTITVIFILSTIVITEIMSNVTAAILFLPIAFMIAHQLGTNPLYLTIPVTLASSCAFMFPVGTPPNALAYSTGILPSIEMMKAGAILAVLSITVIVLFSLFFIPAVF